MDQPQMIGMLRSVARAQIKTTEESLRKLNSHVACLDDLTDTATSGGTLPKGETLSFTTMPDTVSVDEMCSVPKEAGKGDSANTMYSQLSLEINSLVSLVVQAQSQLQKATRSFGWKWAVIATVTLGSTLAVFLTVAWAIIAVQQRSVNELSAQRHDLQKLVSDLKFQAAELNRRGAKISMSQCGPEQRLCIEVNREQGKGINDFRGIWDSKDGKKRYVIPEGY